MDKVLKRKKDDSMYDSRYIELEKLMNIINKLNKDEHVSGIPENTTYLDFK